MYSDAYVTLTGNLVRDPELKTVNENNVCSFVIAVNTGKKDVSVPGQPYIANYYNCSAWGDTGAYLMEKIEKGTQVKVLGDLRVDAYLSPRDKTPHPNLRVTALDVKILARGKDWRKQKEVSDDSAGNDHVAEEAAG